MYSATRRAGAPTIGAVTELRNDFPAGVITGHAVTEGFGMLVLAYVAGMVCWSALRRFLMLLTRAEHLASRSTCAACGTNGRYEVLDEQARMRVRCRKCAHEWTID